MRKWNGVGRGGKVKREAHEEGGGYLWWGWDAEARLRHWKRRRRRRW